MTRRVPERDWVWCAYPGHFIAAASCRMHLSTTIGPFVVSTVGDYFPRDTDEPSEIGSGRLYETYVFRHSGRHHDCGAGFITDWGEIDRGGYNDSFDAERGHMDMCRKYAKLGAQEQAA